MIIIGDFGGGDTSLPVKRVLPLNISDDSFRMANQYARETLSLFGGSDLKLVGGVLQESTVERMGYGGGPDSLVGLRIAAFYKL